MSENLSWSLIIRDRGQAGLNSFGRGLEGVQRRTQKFSDVAKAGFKAVGTGAAVGLAAAGAAAAKFVFDGVKAAISYQKVLAKTAAVIKSTGGAAHISVAGVKALAGELESMSGVDEELIINSQNVLATFTNIRNVGKNRIFDMATKSALDMSVALGSDLQGASIQLGKALNDPIKGISALSKVGVTFTEAQKKVIAQLVKTGDTAGAQKVILAELNKEFGGQAAAAGNTFEGSMARVQDAIGDTGREIGTALLPKLTEIADWTAKKIPVAVQEFKDGWKGVGDGKDLNGLAHALHDLSVELGNINKQAGEADSNGFVKFAKWGINAMTTFTESFKVLGNNWVLVKTSIEKWNLEIQVSFQKMVNGIADAGAKLPGPMGEHFRKIKADGVSSLRELQGKLTEVNTRHAQAEAANLETKLIRLGRQKPSPKVTAQTAEAKARLADLRNQIAKVRGKSITITTYYKGIYLPGSQPGTKGNGLGVIAKGQAGGGPYRKGEPYWVGEKGPELRIPNENGMTLTARQSAQLAGGGGGSGYVSSRGGGVTINVIVQGAMLSTHREVRTAVTEAFNRAPAGASKPWVGRKS